MRELVRACKTADLYARYEAGVVNLDVGDSTGAQAITVEATSAEMGDFGAELPAQIEGEPVCIALNCRFLLEALGAIDSVQVVLDLNGPERAVTIRPQGDDGLTHVIMPMHVRG